MVKMHNVLVTVLQILVLKIESGVLLVENPVDGSNQMMYQIKAIC